MKGTLLSTFNALLLMTTHVSAELLNDVLQLEESPVGIVIEVTKADGDALHEHLIEVRTASDAIRQKFPGLPIAIVSHGHEQFALTSANAGKYRALHADVEDLVKNDIDVHVCGTHASWYDIAPEDYPEFIDVTHAGPAQINDYLNIGYVQLEL